MQMTTKRLVLVMLAGLMCLAGLCLMTVPLFPGVPVAVAAAHSGTQQIALGFTRWMTVTVDATANVGESPSLGLDALGVPHIAYHDVTNDAVKHVLWSGPAWVSTTVDTAALSPSLALDSAGQPRIAYTQRGPSINYAIVGGTMWMTQTVDSDHVSSASLALDHLGNPHIAYCDVRSLPPVASGLGVKYAYWTSGGWTIGVIEQAQCDAISLALDTLDKPHVAYHNMGTDSVTYAVLDSTAWVTGTVDTTSLDPSLALDQSNEPHIAYTLRGPQVRYASKSGLGWITETVDSEMVGGPSLVLDSLERPHLAYCDVRPVPPGGPGHGLKYAIKSAGGWGIQAVDGASCAAPSLAVDASDNPRIAYYAKSALRYAYLLHELYLPLVKR